MSPASHMLGSWVQIPPGGIDDCCERCALSSRGLSWFWYKCDRASYI